MVLPQCEREREREREHREIGDMCVRERLQIVRVRCGHWRGVRAGGDRWGDADGERYTGYPARCSKCSRHVFVWGVCVGFQGLRLRVMVDVRPSDHAFDVVTAPHPIRGLTTLVTIPRPILASWHYTIRAFCSQYRTGGSLCRDPLSLRRARRLYAASAARPDGATGTGSYSFVSERADARSLSSTQNYSSQA